MSALAETHTIPVENLLSPDVLRRLAWQPPEPIELAPVQQFLLDHGARAWQLELSAEALTVAMTSAPETIEPEMSGLEAIEPAVTETAVTAR